MEPTYQVPWERLAEAYRQLVACKAGNDVMLRPIFFLCGLKFQLTYYEAARGGTDARATHYGAGHTLDDGLDDACRIGLKNLVKITRSRELRNLDQLEVVKARGNPDWLFLKLAFVVLDDDLSARAHGWPATVRRWLRNGEVTTNWIRLSFGMGVRAMWDALPFTLALRRHKPIAFLGDEGLDITSEVRGIVASFEWNADWVVPEV